MELVPGRNCGECSVCCTVLDIDTPEFQKMPRIPCPHLGPGGHGCSIHETTYPVCRTYHCAWRYIEEMSEDWRPDRSGVLLEFQTEGFPAQYTKLPGLRITITGPRETVFDPSFATLLTTLIKAEIPATLSILAPPKHFPVGIFVNDELKAGVMARDSARIVATLRNILFRLESAVCQPVEHKNKAEP